MAEETDSDSSLIVEGDYSWASHSSPLSNHIVSFKGENLDAYAAVKSKSGFSGSLT